ncbi:MAG: T9SS type A sorting domain-containing protein [Bacteroidetes bacterium]|nr:T9SS type A sorting domain-containing protein [Bacteroidota bacterium]
MMSKIKYIIILFLLISLKIKGQTFSPFVYPIANLNDQNSIITFKKNIYLSISTKNPTEGFTIRIIELSKNLKNFEKIQVLSPSLNGRFKVCKNSLIGYSHLEGKKNLFNNQFTLLNENSLKINIIGDSSNFTSNATDIFGDILFTGHYLGKPFPNYSMRESAFLARYSINGFKTWEKYYRMELNGFKRTLLTYSKLTKKNQIFSIGLSYFDSAGRYRQSRIITAIIDSNGNMLKANSDLDSLFMESTSTASEIAKRPLLPELVNPEAVQVNDSVIASFYYDLRGIAPPFWVFFKDDGSVLNIRKAWLFRDTLANPITINSQYFKGLIKKKNGSGFLALAIYGDSGYRLIELDDEMYVKKEIPVYNPFGSNSLFSILEAFAEDEDGSLYTLSALFIDSIDPTDFYGAMVCKFDSNGTLLSNGPLFPVGLPANNSTESIAVFPNPCHDIIQINVTEKTTIHLLIFNSQGKLMDEQFFNESLSYNTQQFPAGVYWFKLSNNKNEWCFKKVIKLE